MEYAELFICSIIFDIYVIIIIENITESQEIAHIVVLS